MLLVCYFFCPTEFKFTLLSLLQKEEMINPKWHNTWSSTLLEAVHDGTVG